MVESVKVGDSDWPVKACQIIDSSQAWPSPEMPGK